MKLPKITCVNNGKDWEIADNFWEREYKPDANCAREPTTDDWYRVAFHCKISDLERFGIDLSKVKHEPDPFDEEKVYIYGEHEKISDCKYLFKPTFVNRKDENNDD